MFVLVSGCVRTSGRSQCNRSAEGLRRLVFRRVRLDPRNRNSTSPFHPQIHPVFKFLCVYVSLQARRVTVIFFQAVREAGGRFLEAPVIGSRSQAEDGSLVMVASGDKTLYTDCSSCFAAMAKSSVFLGKKQHLPFTCKLNSIQLLFVTKSR